MLRIQYMLTTARRSLKNPLLIVTIVSLNHAMASLVFGFVVIALSPPLYGEMPRQMLILRLMQAVVFP